MIRGGNLHFDGIRSRGIVHDLFLGVDRFGNDTFAMACLKFPVVLHQSARIMGDRFGNPMSGLADFIDSGIVFVSCRLLFAEQFLQRLMRLRPQVI
jgi:hypothetical protein